MADGGVGDCYSSIEQIRVNRDPSRARHDGTPVASLHLGEEGHEGRHAETGQIPDEERLAGTVQVRSNRDSGETAPEVARREHEGLAQYQPHGSWSDCAGVESGKWARPELGADLTHFSAVVAAWSPRASYLLNHRPWVKYLEVRLAC